MLTATLSILMFSAALAAERGGPDGGPMAGGQSPAQKPLITASIEVPETVELGKAFLAGVKLTVVPEWHTYWPGQNDSGTPTVLSWTLPKGFSTGTVVYPAPIRHLGGGDVLDYVLEGAFTIMVPIAIDDSVKPGSYQFDLDVQALVCKDSCVPQSCTASVEVRVKHGADEPAVDLKKLPTRTNWQSHVDATWTGKGDAAILSIKPRGATAKHLEFYPYEDSAELIDPITSGITDTGELKLTFKPQGKIKPGDKPKPVYGVVRVGSGPTSPTYEIKIDLPATADTTAAKPAELSAPLPPPLTPAGNNPSSLPPVK